MVFPEFMMASRASGQDVETRLAELGIELTEPTAPIADYVNAVRTGNRQFLSGKGPTQPDGSQIQGNFGSDLTVEEGYAAARLTGVNLPAVLKDELGGLNGVSQDVEVTE